MKQMRSGIVFFRLKISNDYSVSPFFHNFKHHVTNYD